MRQTILQIAVAATLTACAPTMVTQSTAPELALPSPLATSQINMPLDSIRVAAAIVDRLQGGTGLAAGVLFSTSAGQIIDRATRLSCNTPNAPVGLVESLLAASSSLTS